MFKLWSWPCALLLLAVPLYVRGHGQLNDPPSRNYIAYTMGLHYCPHCGQGGGPPNMPSPCGDPFQDKPNINYMATTFGYEANYTEGQVITTTLFISTNHGGRYTFRVCPLPWDQISHDCFNQPQHQLYRSDNGKKYAYLHPGDQTLVGNWKLPDGVSCENGCTLQWWWTAFQFCYLPCESPDVDVPEECGRNLLFPVGQCTNGPIQTEQFFNCADIRIFSSGPRSSPPPATPSSPPPPPATLLPPPPSTPVMVVTSPPPPSPSQGTQPSSGCAVRAEVTAPWYNTATTRGASINFYLKNYDSTDAATPYTFAVNSPSYTGIGSVWNWQGTFSGGMVSGAITEGWQMLQASGGNEVNAGAIFYGTGNTPQDFTPTSAIINGVACSIALKTV